MMRWTGLTVALLFIIISEVKSTAKFKLELSEFSNRNGLLNDQTCCAGQLLNSACTQQCTTFFKVCFKPYQENITPGDCAFGEYTTPILGNNSITFGTQQASFANPMEFPIDFSWPGDFSLIIEALHEPTLAAEELIARFQGSHQLAPLDGWQELTWNTSHMLAPRRLSFKYQIECDDTFYGSNCAKVCAPRDDELGHYECDDQGNKLCRQGWQGEYCDKAICLDGCSKEHGVCNKPNECSCNVGWEGRLCDQCKKYPNCANGYCEEAFQCQCYEGWGGLFCNQDLNYCTNNRPCQNGGTCTNTGEGSYTCSCPIGYSGINCETEIDNCMNAPCQNGGECKDIGNDFLCECPAGFAGSRCEIAARRCEENPCANGATCEPVGSSYRCHCSPAWTGVNCQQEVNECMTVDTPCLNGGRCVDGLGTYSCICEPGFSGDFCELDEDECAGSNPCLNGGQCINGNNRYSCRCRPGFIGDLCETDVDECATRPCANGGSCEDRVNDFVCHCAAGYTGRMCTEQKNECDADVCKNGATCEDHVNGYECHCTQEFTGTHCETRVGDSTTTTTTQRPFNSTSTQPELTSGGAAGVATGASMSEPSSDLQLTQPQLIMIISVCSGVPMGLLFILVIVLFCRRRQRRRAHADKSEEARQNEINGMNNRIHNAMMTNGKADLYEYPITEKKVVDESPVPIHQIPLHYRNSAACQPASDKFVHKEMIKDINRAKELQLLCKSNTSVAPAHPPLTSTARQQYAQYLHQDKRSNVELNKTNTSPSIATVCDSVLSTDVSNNSNNSVYMSPSISHTTVCDV